MTTQPAYAFKSEVRCGLIIGDQQSLALLTHGQCPDAGCQSQKGCVQRVDAAFKRELVLNEPGDQRFGLAPVCVHFTPEYTGFLAVWAADSAVWVKPRIWTLFPGRPSQQSTRATATP